MEEEARKGEERKYTHKNKLSPKIVQYLYLQSMEILPDILPQLESGLINADLVTRYLNVS